MSVGGSEQQPVWDDWGNPLNDAAQATDDVAQARDLFGDKSEYVPGVGRVSPAVNQKAVALLRDDPEEYFRLNRIWLGVGRG